MFSKSLYHFLILFLLVSFAIPANAAEIWVAPSGNNKSKGSIDSPLASLDIALRKARELRRLNDPSISNGIHIILKGGIYTIDETIFIRPEDSGTPNSPTIIRAATGEVPVFSGGKRIIGWKRLGKKVEGIQGKIKDNIWVADAPVIGDQIVDFRQMWVDNKKGVRSKSTNKNEMQRILSWNHEDESCWVPKPDIPSFEFTPGMEFFIHQWWAIANLRIKSAEIKGDSVRLSFFQPESRIQSEHPWPAPWISKETGNSAFYLTNSLQFLDEPGEWHLDKAARKVYYWPLEGEKMNSAKVIAPYLETLLTIQGTIDNPVSHVSVEGITFRHSTWLRPSLQGHVPLQAGMYLLDAYKLKIPGTDDKASLENQGWVGRPPAAVEVSYSQFTKFADCKFENLASTGLDYHKGNYSDQVIGNVFRDIGGNGILIGTFSDEAFESHRPYNPTDKREVSRNVRIANNLITNVSNEDWGCVGIGAGFVSGIRIENNDISEVSYTGISVGWGWIPKVNVMSDNYIIANKIHRYGKHMYDVAGIYTLSAQPGSIIAKNHIDSIYEAKYAHLPDHWFYLYTDEGSAYFRVYDNWYPSDKTLQNSNGPGNEWKNNGPQVADSVKYLAGLQKDYQHLLDYRSAASDEYSINVYIPFTKPVLVQVESLDTMEVGIDALEKVAKSQGINDPSFFKWGNHFILFTYEKEAKKFQGAVIALLPSTKATVFDDLFYEFNREYCESNATVNTFKHILLTANLVEDESLQSEYLNYHKVQFEQWPEVSQGFCNANFQEVLLYKNERQLLLVISIPEGEDFEELNPKTIENNPRVIEWNNLMGKYQEGLPNAKPDEVWVFFEEL
jgi:L-rhamnose mutarotase